MRSGLSFVVVSVVGLLGCSSEAPDSRGFPEEPLTVTSTTSGTVVVELRTAPQQPPVRGRSQFELTLRTAEGTPLPDVALDTSTWMPAMGHGAPTEPTCSSDSDGACFLSDMDLFMPGSWELRLTLTGAATDSAVVLFDVL